MSYTSNPYAPKARKLATNLVRRGKTQAEVARLYGVHRATIGKWVKKATKHSLEFIPTKSSAPHHSPNALCEALVARVIEIRKANNRCAEVVHHQLIEEGEVISLSSVKRIFRREKLTRKKKRPRFTNTRFRRPLSTNPGALVEMDTIHFVTNKLERFYIYTAIDTFTRFAYAEFQPSISGAITCEVLRRTIQAFPFPIQVMQTDNGQEFSFSVEVALRQQAIRLRHTRVKKPNDNAHIERFNRTLQEECFDSPFPNKKTIPHQLTVFLDYYNFHRPHLGIHCKIPQEMLPSS